jgi:hypothetical protein
MKTVDDKITAQFAEAIKFQRLHDTGDVVPMVQFIQGCGTRYTDKRGFGMYLNKIGMRTKFVPCLNPKYFTEFEGKEAVEKYPYVLWFERKDTNG